MSEPQPTTTPRSETTDAEALTAALTSLIKQGTVTLPDFLSRGIPVDAAALAGGVEVSLVRT